MKHFSRLSLHRLAALPALVGLFAFFASSRSAAAQDFLPFKLGVKGGVPMFSTFDTNAGPNSRYNSVTRRWLVGPTVEFRVAGPLSFEVDALFKRTGFDYSGPDVVGTGTLFRPTVANWWEFPALFKYKFTAGRFRPFVDFGASLRHITSMKETTYTAANFAPIIADNSVAIRNRNSAGGVFGVGADFAYKRLRVSPEVRYTRWWNQAFADNNNLLKTNLNQLDFLMGFTF